MIKIMLSTAIASILMNTVVYAKSAAFEHEHQLQSMRSGETAIISTDHSDARNTVMRHHHHHHRRK